MMRMASLIGIFIAWICATPVHAQGFAYPDIKSVVPLGKINVGTTADAVNIRAALTSSITGGAASLVSPTLTVIDDLPMHGGNPTGYFGRTPTFSKWLAFTWPNDGGYYGSVNARIHFSSFYADAPCLVIYNGGHGQDFFPAATLAAASPSRDLMRRIVNEVHCDVILSSMPIQGENAQFSVQRGYATPPYYIHDMLGQLGPYMTGSPLRFWLEDVYGAVSYALSRKSYQQVVMTGYSGGGWTTTMLAALDPRITASYALAGSVPLGLRKLTDWGDWEQLVLANFGVDYPDLYLAGTVDAAGVANRKAWLFWNTDDECCFSRDAYSGFVYGLNAHAASHGFSGLQMFSFFGMAHDYSAQVNDAIVKDIFYANRP